MEVKKLTLEEVVRLQRLHQFGSGWWTRQQCMQDIGDGVCVNIKGHSGPHWTWDDRTWAKARRITEYVHGSYNTELADDKGSGC